MGGTPRAAVAKVPARWERDVDGAPHQILGEVEQQVERGGGAHAPARVNRGVNILVHMAGWSIYALRELRMGRRQRRSMTPAARVREGMQWACRANATKGLTRLMILH